MGRTLLRDMQREDLGAGQVLLCTVMAVLRADVRAVCRFQTGLSVDNYVWRPLKCIQASFVRVNSNKLAHHLDLYVSLWIKKPKSTL